MSGGDPAKIAGTFAEQVVRDHQIVALPVDPFAIAKQLNIEVVPKETTGGVSGMLVRVGNSFAIGYATHIDSDGFRRFCVGHELGHYFLPGHIEAVLDQNGRHASRAGFASPDRYEVEADHFAAGLLMPKQLFRPALDKAGQGAKAILRLADLCGTSVPATAIRVTQCTRDPMAIVVSEGASIDYCFMSDELKQLDGIDWLRKRQAVPKDTPTHEFNKNSENVRSCRRVESESDLQTWFGGKRSIEMREDVVGLGSYGKTLTVLYGIEMPDEEEEEDEKNFVESWTPRFKR